MHVGKRPAQRQRKEMLGLLATMPRRQGLHPGTQQPGLVGGQGIERGEPRADVLQPAQRRQPATCLRCEGMCDGIRKKLSVVTKAQDATNQKKRFTAGSGCIAR
ncbi:MAG: hypothetical protein RLZZ393_702 [Pseudomonadota bacterium]